MTKSTLAALSNFKDTRPIGRDTRLYVASVTITLLAFALRVVAMVDVPPGWRDDELINIHALAGRLLDGQFPLYFTGASGHEPLYHYLQAATNAVLGYNILSGHLPSIFLGTLTIPLTFVLSRRLFGSRVALLTTLGLSVSFWSLMYSRIALRHVMLPPVALIVFYLIWSPLRRRRQHSLWWAVGLGSALATTVYIYPAARLLPALLVGFGFYLALFHAPLARQVWRGYTLALVLALVLVLPLVLAIRQGSSTEATQGIGADARLAELARPVRALQEGDPEPLLENISVTLGMFHATGDPEWLYNIANRPVFNLLGGLLFWAGVLLCLYRWREPRYFFLLLWLGIGLLPTMLSIPPASLSHSILVQPLAYLLPVLTLVNAQQWLAARSDTNKRLVHYGLLALASLFLLTNGIRDLYDYFYRWPQQEMVQFLYRADYRQAAHYLEAHSDIQDVAIGSTILGPWDRLALQEDLQRQDAHVRLFNPEWSLLIPAQSDPDKETAILTTLFPAPDPRLAELMGRAPLWEQKGLRRYATPAALPKPSVKLSPPTRFSNGLALIGAAWPDGGPVPGQERVLWLMWEAQEPLELPPMPIVANPPPPGVYNGPRMAVFSHLLTPDDVFLTASDGLWVDPTTLRPGDRFLQIHPIKLPADAPPGIYVLQVGLYDPLTGQRWPIQNTGGEAVTDYVQLPVRMDNIP